MDTVMYLAGRTLPKYNYLTRAQPVVEYTNQTLDGRIYTDFFARKREWTIAFPLLTVAEYTTLQEIFEEQFTLNRYPVFQFDAQSIYAVVKVEISDQGIAHGAQYVESFSIRLIERVAIS